MGTKTNVDRSMGERIATVKKFSTRVRLLAGIIRGASIVVASRFLYSCKNKVDRPGGRMTSESKKTIKSASAAFARTFLPVAGPHLREDPSKETRRPNLDTKISSWEVGTDPSK